MYGQGITRGKSAILSNPATTNQACAAILPNEHCDPYFTFKYLEYSYGRIRNLSNDGSQKNLSAGLIKGFPVPIPPLLEQKKIAKILSTWDQAIEKLEKLIELKEKRKKGSMQQLLTGKKRLSGFGKPFVYDGDFPDKWKNVKLNNYLYESKERNFDLKYSKKHVLSVSGEYGVINQIEFMGRSYAGKSVANYHVVNSGDIVYTKSPLKRNPYGIIKVNECEPGIVSTLYAVYSCNSNISGKYLEYYFQIDDNTNRYLRPLVRKGAKNDMKINNEHVLSGKLLIPSLKEQLDIVTFCELCDAELFKAKSVKTNIVKQKKGLMQKLLTGELRVNTEGVDIA